MLADAGLRGSIAVGFDEVTEVLFVEVCLGEAAFPGDDDDGERIFESGGEDGVVVEVGGDALEGVELCVGDLVGVVGDPDDAVFEGVDGVALVDGVIVDTRGGGAGVVGAAGGGVRPGLGPREPSGMWPLVG